MEAIIVFMGILAIGRITVLEHLLSTEIKRRKELEQMLTKARENAQY